LVLASASPRRRELLRRLVRDFVVIPSALDERLEPGPFVESITRLAEAKARVVVAQAVPGSVVLAAHTMVIVDGEALGKSADAADARAMLRRLRGREHDVITGLAVMHAPRGPVRTATVVSRVVMARYPETLIEAYVASGGPLDKAGGYAIQD